jgi:hypothetical protein
MIREANARTWGLSSGRTDDSPTPRRSRPPVRRSAPAVDEYAAMHNNTFMNRASLAPVILLNTVRSTGATG